MKSSENIGYQRRRKVSGVDGDNDEMGITISRDKYRN